MGRAGEAGGRAGENRFHRPDAGKFSVHKGAIALDHHLFRLQPGFGNDAIGGGDLLIQQVDQPGVKQRCQGAFRATKR